MANVASGTLYWQAVNASMKTLPETGLIHITSQDVPQRGIVGGVTFDTTRENAAQRLAEGTHRRSTSSEVEAFKLDQEKRIQDSKIDELRKKEQSVVVLSEHQAHGMGLQRSKGQEHTQVK